MKDFNDNSIRLQTKFTKEEQQHYADLLKPKLSQECKLKFDNSYDIYHTKSLIRKPNQSANSRPVRFAFYIAAQNLEAAKERARTYISFYNYEFVAAKVRITGINTEYHNVQDPTMNKIKLYQVNIQTDEIKHSFKILAFNGQMARQKALSLAKRRHNLKRPPKMLYCEHIG